MTSFQRQLNLYGFRKIFRGEEKDCYCHPYFKKDNKELLSCIKRPSRTKRIKCLRRASDGLIDYRRIVSDDENEIDSPQTVTQAQPPTISGTPPSHGNVFNVLNQQTSEAELSTAVSFHSCQYNPFLDPRYYYQFSHLYYSQLPHSPLPHNALHPPDYKGFPDLPYQMPYFYYPACPHSVYSAQMSASSSFPTETSSADPSSVQISPVGSIEKFVH
jgi:hypothetical protein